jgi:peptidoglycan/LPS O-acetylase OafA/YrhL
MDACMQAHEACLKVPIYESEFLGFSYGFRPKRKWDLLLGVLAATFSVSLLDWRPLREAVSLSGLALIVASILHYTPQTHFPGLHALKP